MSTNDINQPVEIFSGTIWEAETLKSLLENAEIKVFLKDEITGTLAPWQSAPGGVGSVKVVVSGSDSEKAMLIVKEYKGNKK
jgi:hypothetical protein